MLQLKHDRRLVLSTSGGRFVADDGKPREVFLIVLNIRGDRIQPVLDARLDAGDRRRSRFVARHLGGGGGTGDLDGAGKGKVRCQPATTLGLLKFQRI